MKNLAIMLALVAGFTLVGCGGDDAPAADPTKSAVAFEVNLTSKVDGTNDLAAVLTGEGVFLAGDFGLAASTSTTPGGCNYDADTFSSTTGEYMAAAVNAFPCWKPSNSALATTSADGKKYTKTMNLLRGTKIEYKAVKSYNKSCTDGAGKTGKDLLDKCGWSNGIKKWFTAANYPAACPASTTGGLFEISNYKFTVPDAATSTAPAIAADGWRDYAASKGAVICN
jgi:hypothetical protein